MSDENTQGNEEQVTNSIPDNSVTETSQAGSVEPVVTVQEPPKETKTKKVGVSFEEKITELKSKGTLAQRGLISEIESYISKMKPGMPVEFSDGATQQWRLWNILNNLLNKANHAEFKQLWSLVLAYFYEHRDGVFNERYVFRFAEYWNYDPTALDSLQRLINLILLTRDQSKMSAGLKKVDLKRTLEKGFTEEASKRLLTFYNQ